MVAAMAEMGEKIVDVRDLVSELSLRINCRTTFNKAFLHSERVPSSGTGLDPQAYRKLEAENIKLLATHNTLDMIPSLRLVLGRFDLGGINAKWTDVTMRKVSCAESILEWYRQHVPDGSVSAEGSETDFVETLLRLCKEGKYTVTIARSIILVRFRITRVLRCCHSDFVITRCALDATLGKILNSRFYFVVTSHLVQELLTAGSDTIASTLEWSLLELVRQPLYLERLQAEIDTKFGMSGPVEEEEAAQLPYLQVTGQLRAQSRNCSFSNFVFPSFWLVVDFQCFRNRINSCRLC